MKNFPPATANRILEEVSKDFENDNKKLNKELAYTMHYFGSSSTPSANFLDDG